MKRKLKKAVAVILTAAMAMSVGVPAFAATEESTLITDDKAREIISTLSQEYNVELVAPHERMQVVMTEEEFILRTELLAVIGANIDNPSDELLVKQNSLLAELNEKYPVEKSVSEDFDESNADKATPMYDFLYKTISKDNTYVTITTKAMYMINSSGVKLFVGVDDVDNDITAVANSDFADRYTFYKTPGSTTQCVLQTAGASMLVTIYGDLIDNDTNIALTSRSQTVNYNNTQL